MIETIEIVIAVLAVFLAGYWFRGQQELLQWSKDSVVHRVRKESKGKENKVEAVEVPKKRNPTKPMTASRFDNIIKSNSPGKD